MALEISRDKWGWAIPGESIPIHPQGMHPHPYLSHPFYKPAFTYCRRSSIMLLALLNSVPGIGVSKIETGLYRIVSRRGEIKNGSFRIVSTRTL